MGTTFQVNQYDTLPKCTCVDCWRRIEDFHNFHRSVFNAQAEYLKRRVKSETEREPNLASYSHDTTSPPRFVEVITNCEEFIEFTDESLKANDEFNDDDHQQEIKLQDVGDLFDDIPCAREDEESNQNTYDNDNSNNDYYEEENDKREAGTISSKFHVKS